MSANTKPKNPACQTLHHSHRPQPEDIDVSTSSDSVARFHSEALEPCGSRGRAHISCPPQLANSSIDTINLTWKIVALDNEIYSRLKTAKQEIQKGSEFESEFSFAPGKSFIWSLQRTGTKLYPYVLKHADITLFLSPRPATSPIPSASLHVGSISCHQTPLILVNQIKNWLKMLGLYVIEEKVGRLDVCADIAVPIALTGIDDQKKMISRCTKTASYFSHRKLTGMQYGRGDIVCRIYDKSQEMIDKSDAEKIMFFYDHWDLPVEVDVTRVEFQLRREAIKTLVGTSDDTSLQEIMCHLPHIWKYLTTEWLVLTGNEVDRKNNHQSRSLPSVLWHVVQTVVDKQLLATKRVKRCLHVSVDSLRKQARGILLSVAAAFGHDSQDSFGIVSTLQGIVANDLFDHLATEIGQKQFKIKQSRAYV
jgi:hypothetical protein